MIICFPAQIIAMFFRTLNCYILGDPQNQWFYDYKWLILDGLLDDLGPCFEKPPYGELKGITNSWLMVKEWLNNGS